ncbi:hypothetical protein [Lactococcus lactis]|uniref:LXG domain-containing protein n=1 Tax=Lactococcus lactis TaxID=1358 RepID=A0AAW8UHZ8_9LACT|nr:hypothetical protein [Lactococcus lactis]MDT2882062.1 hypothetical protein [Lactococcus lactis]MDT2946779.1 hypothetical protein [Lactococcus lactis]MDT2947599.1 hypothetical protein [Lactococcus lactis]
MGLIYNPSDSHGLVSALNANIRTADEMIESLNRASKHLIDALGNKTLSGAAFTAGKGMFSQLVIPTISKASQALDKLKSEAKQYEGFASNAGEELLDEDKLNEQLQNLQTQQAALSSQISFYNQLAASHSDDNALNTSYSDSSRQLSSFMGTTASDIQKIQDKLKKLHEFNTNVSPLFKDSTDEFKTIMSIVLAIGAVEFDKAGKFVLSINNNKDFQRLKELARSGGLPKDVAKDVLSAETVGKVSREIGEFYREKGIRLGSYSDSEANLSRLAKRGTHLKAVGDDFIELSETIGKSKVLKVAGAAGSILSIGLDYDEQMGKYHNQVRALKNTAAHAVLGAGGSAAGAYIGGALGTLIPIPGVGTVLGAVAGAAIGSGLSAGYDWIESGKAAKDIDNFKKSASKTVNNLKNEAEKVFSGWGKSLGGVFG